MPHRVFCNRSAAVCTAESTLKRWHIAAKYSSTSVRAHSQTPSAPVPCRLCTPQHTHTHTFHRQHKTHTHTPTQAPSVRILNFNFVCTHLSVIAEQPHVTTVGATAASGVHDRTKSLSIATHSLYALTHTHILCVRVQIRCASEQQKRTVWPAQCNARPTPPPGAHTG